MIRSEVPYAVLLALCLSLTTVEAPAETTDDKLFFNVIGTGTTGGSPNSTRTYELQLGTPPLYVAERTFFVPTLLLRRTSLSLTDAVGAELSTVQPGFVFSHHFSPKWKVLIVQSAAWRTAGETTFSFSREIAPNGVYFIGYCPRGDDRFCWSGGLVLSNDLNRNQLIPVLGVTYESPSRDFYLQIAFPYSNLLFRSLPDWEYGLAFEFAGGYYSIDPKGPLAGDPNANFLRVRNLFVGPAISYHLTKSLLFNAKGGVNFGRSVENWDDSFNSIPGTERSSPATWFLKTGLSLRFGA